MRTANTVISPGSIDNRSLIIGLATLALIVLLERTRLGALGMVVAVIATSAVAQWADWTSVATLRDLGVAADSLPTPELPLVRLIPSLLVPAVSLAFVGLVQGAGISANFPNPDGRYPDASRDFVGQGAANLASGVLRGMPVGGSVSATSLNKAAGARSRRSLLFATVVMAVVIVAFGNAVGSIAMPTLAGPPDAHRLPDPEPGRRAVRVEDRNRAEGDPGCHLRPDHGHPAPVRRARRASACPSCCTWSASPTR